MASTFDQLIKSKSKDKLSKEQVEEYRERILKLVALNRLFRYIPLFRKYRGKDNKTGKVYEYEDIVEAMSSPHIIKALFAQGIVDKKFKSMFKHLYEENESDD